MKAPVADREAPRIRRETIVMVAFNFEDVRKLAQALSMVGRHNSLDDL